jgi:CHAT domain-containing protein
MLTGKILTANKLDNERSTRVKTKDNTNKSSTFKFNEEAPFAHPYYWSPFVLIGNWK